MMKPTSEIRRFSFVWKRDGVLVAEQWAKTTLRVYIAAARDRRLNHGKHDAYYAKFVEFAWALRWALRHIHNKVL